MGPRADGRRVTKATGLTAKPRLGAVVSAMERSLLFPSPSEREGENYGEQGGLTVRVAGSQLALRRRGPGVVGLGPVSGLVRS